MQRTTVDSAYEMVVWHRSSPSEEVATAPKKAGRKRLPVDHITLDSLQEQGLFDVPIQVSTESNVHGVDLLNTPTLCRRHDVYNKTTTRSDVSIHWAMVVSYWNQQEAGESFAGLSR